MLEAPETAFDAVFEQPEEVLRILGVKKSLQLVQALSVSPEMEALLKESKLVGMINSGSKFVTGIIEKGDSDHA